MRLYLIRHANPEKSTEDDDDPPLSKDGQEAAAALGAWMADKDEVPTVLITSPTLRAQQTAETIRESLEEAGLVPPEIVTDVGIGPHMSIRAAVLKAAQDKAMVRVGIVSHHESLEHGLRVLGLEPFIHLDIFAQCELRIMKVKRKNGKWDEHRRVPPSDLGGDDYY